MGKLQMSIVFLALFVTLIGWIIIPAGALDDENNNTELIESSEGLTRQGANETKYIYETREISDVDEELPFSIVINGSGKFIINNSVTITIVQDYSYHRQITVKDNGTLHLRKGNLVSTHAIIINLQNNGKIILEEESNLKVSKIQANDKSMIESVSSTISQGIGGFIFELGDQTTLILEDRSIVNADTIKADEDSKIIVENSYLNSEEYKLSCKELTLKSNKNFRDLKVDNCKNIFIKDSTITKLEITSCNSLDISESSKLENSFINNIDQLNIYNSDINNLDINEITTVLRIQNSDISNLEMINCTSLEIYNSNIRKSKLSNFSHQIEIHDSLIEKCSFSPSKIKIFNSELDCTNDELEDLTRAEVLEAYNSSFNLPLHIAGTSRAHLTNCSVAGDLITNVFVHDDAIINIYWWLEVRVLDVDYKPLSGAKVIVNDFWDSIKIVEGISDSDGKVVFRLLANTLDKDGWDINKSYILKGSYDEKSAENATRILFNESKVSYLEFGVVKKEDEEDNKGMGIDTIIGIIIFIIVLILIGFSVTGNKKKKNPTDKRESRREVENGNGTKDFRFRKGPTRRTGGRPPSTIYGSL